MLTRKLGLESLERRDCPTPLFDVGALNQEQVEPEVEMRKGWEDGAPRGVAKSAGKGMKLGWEDGLPKGVAKKQIGEPGLV